MGDLRIVIPTFRRMARQATLKNLPMSWRERTVLVVDEADAELQGLYDFGGAKLVVHPPEIKTIASKRAWIIRNYEQVVGSQKILMFDDDLRFAVRISADSDAKLRQAESADVEHHLENMNRLLDLYVHAGWSMRQGNNTKKDGGLVNNGRMCFVLGYDCEKLNYLEQAGRIQLGRIETREDMDLTLQLLRLGLPNAVSFDIAADQVGGYAAKGGCETQRTVESSNADAVKLAELHPGFVKVVEKSYNGSINRQEVIVQWKKAYESARV